MTNEELIQEVRDLAKKLGRTPKRREFKYYWKVYYRYDSWNSFLKEAGLTPLKQFDLTTKDYENIIHDFVKKHGRTPTANDFYNDIYLPDPRTIERKFGKSWSKILISLGYEPNIRMNDFSDVTDEELLLMVKKELERIGSTTQADYTKKRSENAPSLEYLFYRLNMRWNEVLKALGFELNVEQKSKEEWLQLLRDIAKDLGRTPTISDLEKYGTNKDVYKYNFGSWNRALLEAGLEIVHKKDKVSHTDEELLDMYKELCKKLGRAATSKDIDNYLPYSNDVFTIRFGSMNNLRKLAGFEPYYLRRKYTKEELKNKLIKVYKEYGRRLTNNEMKQLSKNNDDFPSISTLCRYFKTTKMSEIWEMIEDIID